MATVDCAVLERPIAAIYQFVEVENRPDNIPRVLEIGTGGMPTGKYQLVEVGYKTRGLLFRVADEATPSANDHFQKLVQEIQDGFGRTMNRIPAVFGVSRQAVYGWLSGEKTPKEIHHNKLEELAEAARFFKSSGFKPTGFDLERVVRDGKSFLALVADGQSGKESAERLVKVVTRGRQKAAALDELLANRPVKYPDAFRIGAPHIDAT